MVQCGSRGHARIPWTRMTATGSDGVVRGGVALSGKALVGRRSALAGIGEVYQARSSTDPTAGARLVSASPGGSLSLPGYPAARLAARLLADAP